MKKFHDGKIGFLAYSDLSTGRKQPGHPTKKNNIYFISNILSAVCDERVDADVCCLFRLKLGQFEAVGPDIGKKDEFG